MAGVNDAPDWMAGDTGLHTRPLVGRTGDWDLGRAFRFSGFSGFAGFASFAGFAGVT